MPLSVTATEGKPSPVGWVVNGPDVVWRSGEDGVRKWRGMSRGEARMERTAMCRR